MAAPKSFEVLWKFITQAERDKVEQAGLKYLMFEAFQCGNELGFQLGVDIGFQQGLEAGREEQEDG